MGIDDRRNLNGDLMPLYVQGKRKTKNGHQCVIIWTTNAHYITAPIRMPAGMVLAHNNYILWPSLVFIEVIKIWLSLQMGSRHFSFSPNSFKLSFIYIIFKKFCYTRKLLISFLFISHLWFAGLFNDKCNLSLVFCWQNASLLTCRIQRINNFQRVLNDL